MLFPFFFLFGCYFRLFSKYFLALAGNINFDDHLRLVCFAGCFSGCNKKTQQNSFRPTKEKKMRFSSIYFVSNALSVFRILAISCTNCVSWSTHTEEQRVRDTSTVWIGLSCFILFCRLHVAFHLWAQNYFVNVLVYKMRNGEYADADLLFMFNDHFMYENCVSSTWFIPLEFCCKYNEWI